MKKKMLSNRRTLAWELILSGIEDKFFICDVLKNSCKIQTDDMTDHLTLYFGIKCHYVSRIWRKIWIIRRNKKEKLINFVNCEGPFYIISVILSWH